jgi:NAD+ synthase
MLKIDCKKETERIVKFIQETFKEKGFKKAVLGISGGLDSAVICSLLIKALGKDNVIGVMLPYGEQKDIDDSITICINNKISATEANIEKVVHSIVGKEDIGDVRKGNICARVRMIALYDISAKYKALVVGTGNKTELMLGYFTMYGDGACALEPIGHLYKTQVRQLAKYLKIPKRIIDKAPSAGLWEGQTDEKELGMTYEEMDEMLYCIYGKYDVGTLPKNKTFETKKLDILADRVNKNKFKMELPRCLS